jgi:2',3'-cyclic-nucleotide 2'-phosphodiesterase (5'-nucleotidase family)
MLPRRSYFLAILIGFDLIAILILCAVQHLAQTWLSSASLIRGIAPFALSLVFAVAAAIGVYLSGGRRAMSAPLTYGAGWGAAVLAVAGLVGFLSGMTPQDTTPPDGEFVTLLAVNDIYRIEGVENGRRGGLARLRTLRAELEAKYPGRVVLLHAGDVIFPSLLSRMFKGQQMIDVLNLLDGDGGAGRFDDRMLVAFGNHEFEKEGKCDSLTDAPLQSRVTESDFYWVASNIQFTPCPGPGGRLTMFGANLAPSRVMSVGTLRLGVFGLTLKSEHPSYVFEDPVAIAKAATADLRMKGADIVIALTHLDVKDDLAIYSQLGAQGPDLIIGGHDHDHMAVPAGDPHIFKADADAVSAWVIEVRRVNGKISIKANLRQLDASILPDPKVATRVESWLGKHEYRFCREAGNPSPTCLSDPLAKTKTAFHASETSIRGGETTVGNWIGDLILETFATCGANAALINSGTLRLNQDLAAGDTVTLRHVEELIEYRTILVPSKIREDALWQVMENSAQSVGTGGWLQVAGVRMRYDRSAASGSRVTRLAIEQKGRPPVDLRKDGKREFTIVATEYMRKGKDDGYNTILPDNSVACPGAQTNLKDIVRAALAPSAKGAGLVEIAPKEEGRVCEIHEVREECGSTHLPSGSRP